VRDGIVLQVLTPPDGYQGAGFGHSLAWVPDYYGLDRGALLVGMKYGDASDSNTGTGVVAVFGLDPAGQGFVSTPEMLLAPDPQGNDAFGGAIVSLGDVAGDGLYDFFVGMESHIEGDIFTGVQTGGVVFYH